MNRWGDTLMYTKAVYNSAAQKNTISHFYCPKYINVG